MPSHHEDRRRGHYSEPVGGPLAERTFPDLAAALRGRVQRILEKWEEQVRRQVVPAREFSLEAVRDSLPEILQVMADCLESGDPEAIKRLMDRSPTQGIHRFEMHYNTWDLATEDRLLRWVIVEQVSQEMGRRTTPEEDAALHWAIDLMGQQAMVAFVTHQNERLRAAAEAELKYLSFLSHDLNGNLGNVTLWLQILKTSLGDLPQFAEQVSTLDQAQRAILDTIGGMGRLLQAERLRHQGVTRPTIQLVDLQALVETVLSQHAVSVQQKGLTLTAEVAANAKVVTDGELIRLVLQNLVGNAVKYSRGDDGRVRVKAELAQAGPNAGHWILSVTDNGPGIAETHLSRIFDAFARGEMHGQHGIGLGLAIASRAAKLLGAELSVESQLGKGSTFRLILPLERK